MILQLFQLLLHAGGNLDNIGPRRLGDAEAQGLLAVNAVNPVLLRSLIGNLSDVVQP